MALTLLAANNAQTVLAAGISASATSMTVNSGTGALFPAPSAGVSFFKLTLIDAATGQLTEIVHVTARSGDTMTIDRAQEGTTARAWSANDIAANMMTAGTLSYLLTNFQPLDATLSAIAALTGAANKLAYFNGPDTAALTNLTSVGRDIISKSTIADILTYLGLVDSNGIVGRLINTQVFTASGTYTPTTGTKKIRVTLTGGGGGASGCQGTNTSQTVSGAGGGAGGTVIATITSLSSSYTVTIGAGGSGSSSSASGTAGGNSTFGALIASGGGAGTLSSSGATVGGAGGAASGGSINIVGGIGSDGQAVAFVFAGNGGASYWGGGGRAGALLGVAAIAYGAGGGGAYDRTLSGTAYSGGAGKSGICIIEEFA